MDSGNTSGSMQSSSGGDEEYDSRAESISALLSNNNNHPQNDAVHVHHQHHHHQSSMFDPLSNFFDSSRSLHPNPLLNLDMVWPKPVRSDPNSSSDIVSLIPSSTQPNFLTDNHSIQLGQTRSSLVAGSSNLPAFQIPPEMQTQTQAQTQNRSLTSSATDRNDAVIPSNGAAATATRNPKKRSRASRRAPTTVLTTDTSNFRAMVQEFTGIPAPPFTSSPFPRTRLDLFGSGSGMGIRSGPLDQHHHPSPASYSLLRPFAQKIQQTMPFSSSSSSPTTTSSGALNYQIQSSSAPQNSFLNIQNNPVLSFHSLLQNAPAKFPKNNNVGSASASGSGLLEHDQFGLSHVNVNSNVKVNPPQQLGGLPNPPSTTTNTTTVNWGSSTDHGMGSNDNNNGNNGNNNNNNNNSNVDEGLLLRSINGGYTANNTTGSGISNGHKLNYSASSSTDFHGSTKTEINMAARSEGMVESWICSSD